MSLNGLFLSFSALCDFLKKYFFSKKNFKNFFEKNNFSKRFQQLFFEYFWALDMAPTWDDPVLFLQTTILTLIGPLFLQFLQS